MPHRRASRQPLAGAEAGVEEVDVRRPQGVRPQLLGTVGAGHRLEPHVGHVARGPRRRRSRLRDAEISSSSSRARAAQVSKTWPLGSHGCAANRAGSVDAAGPAVVEVERGAVVDHPEVAVPDQEVGVAPRPVDVGGEGVEPEDAGALVVGRAHLAVDAERAGQEVDAEVGADAGVEQVLHLLVGLVAGELGVEVEHDEARGAQPEPGRQAADDDLGDEHLRALAGAAELADVGAEVVTLDDAGQAAALAQRGDVARDGDERRSPVEITGPGPPRRAVRFSASTSKSAFGHCRSSPRSVSRSSWATARLRNHFLSDGMTCHGATCGAGALERDLVGLAVGRPERALVEVAGVVLPVLLRVGEPLLEARLLLVGADVEHALDDRVALAGQPGLELVDRAVPALDLVAARRSRGPWRSGRPRSASGRRRRCSRRAAGPSRCATGSRGPAPRRSAP